MRGNEDGMTHGRNATGQDRPASDTGEQVARVRGYVLYGNGPNCGACGYTGYGPKVTFCGWCTESPTPEAATEEEFRAVFRALADRAVFFGRTSEDRLRTLRTLQDQAARLAESPAVADDPAATVEAVRVLQDRIAETLRGMRA